VKEDYTASRRRCAEMKITVRRDTWTASAAAVAAAAAAIQAVVGARPSGSVGPRSDRSKRWQPALPAR